MTDTQANNKPETGKFQFCGEPCKQLDCPIRKRVIIKARNDGMDQYRLFRETRFEFIGVACPKCGSHREVIAVE